jgi:hypothetical protein
MEVAVLAPVILHCDPWVTEIPLRASAPSFAEGMDVSQLPGRVNERLVGFVLL